MRAMSQTSMKAFSSAVPMPIPWWSGSMPIVVTHPLTGREYSGPPMEPIMKPTTCPSISATNERGG